MSVATIERVRERLVEESLTAALNRHRPKSPRLRKLDGEQEAYLIALTCSQPEEGQQRWTLQLLVELRLVESISRETVRQVLHTNELKPWLKEQWCLPPKSSAEFVCHMEEVLDVYTRPYDARYPQVCAASLLINSILCSGRISRDDLCACVSTDLR